MIISRKQVLLFVSSLLVVVNCHLSSTPPQLVRLSNNVVGLVGSQKKSKRVLFAQPGEERQHYVTPERPTNCIKPSPGERRVQLVNFHKNIIDALNEEKPELLAQYFYQYFDKIPYNLVIKDKRFYLSLFYSLFALIAQKAPYFYHFSDTLAVPLKARCGKVYVLEFSFTDRSKDQVYEHCCRGGATLRLPVYRITCDVSNFELNFEGWKKPKAPHVFYYYKNEVCSLEYSQNNSPRAILTMLETGIFDSGLMEKCLLDLYSLIPQEFRIESERYYQAMFVLLIGFVRAGSTLWEVISRRGRSDCEIFTEKNIYVVEFKFNKRNGISEALKQIQKQGYCAQHRSAKKDIYMVGVSVSSINGLKIDSAAELYNLPAREFRWCDGDDSSDSD